MEKLAFDYFFHPIRPHEAILDRPSTRSLTADVRLLAVHVAETMEKDLSSSP